MNIYDQKVAPKEAARKFLYNQVKTRQPIPSQAEIRRQLGWPMQKVAK